MIIKFTSPSDLRKWSCGEVKKEDMPSASLMQKEALFSEEIFGELRSKKCHCGNIVTSQSEVCGRCGDFLPRKARRDRLGHIELAHPVVSPFFWQPSPLYWGSSPSILAFLLDKTDEDLSQEILYKEFVDFNAVEVPDKPLRENGGYHKSLFAATGSQAILDALNNIKVDKLITAVRRKLNSSMSVAEKMIFVKQLKTLEAFEFIPLDPGMAVLEAIPVAPPDTRPEWLHQAYANVIKSNNRLRRLMELKAPSVYIFNEMHILQRRVDSLFCRSESCLLRALIIRLTQLMNFLRDKDLKILNNYGTHYYDAKVLKSMKNASEQDGEISILANNILYKGYRGDFHVAGEPSVNPPLDAITFQVNPNGDMVKLREYAIVTEYDILQDIFAILGNGTV